MVASVVGSSSLRLSFSLKDSDAACDLSVSVTSRVLCGRACRRIETLRLAERSTKVIENIVALHTGESALTVTQMVVARRLDADTLTKL